METKVLRVSQIAVSTGLPESWPQPIKPEWFEGKHEARLARAVGLSQFGVNLVTLEPGSMTSLRHWHEVEDEFVYVLSGEVTLVDDNGEHALGAATIAGFPANCPNAHHLINRSGDPATILVVGSRRPGEDTVHYPDDGIGPFRK